MQRGFNDVPADADVEATRREFLLRTAAGAGIAAAAASGMTPGSVLAHASRAHARRSPLPSPHNLPIDHFVILMMENRSFDHYFGWLPHADGRQHQTFTDPDTGQRVATRHVSQMGKDAMWQGCGHPDPGHGWDAGRAQLAQGFLAGDNDEFAISYYNKDELGFIHPAGQAFTVYDRYFCSLLGPTWPNRYYKWSAQSGGKKDNSPPLTTAGNQWPTIFDVAEAAGLSVRYFNSDLPFSAVWGPRGVKWTLPVDEYYAAAATGTLPNITILDPPFRDGGGFDGNSADEHPLGDVRLGQAFMSDVVHAFLESPNFRRGALFIVYDEWGGFFDHVRPPSVPDDRSSPDINANFGQMGFRIPAVTISPFTLGGGVSHLQLGHESILKLIEYRFGLAPLTTRDRYANNVGRSFDWRTDPDKVEVPDLPRPAHVVSKPCTFGGGDVVEDPGGAHAGDMDALELLAERFGFRVGEGRPHHLFREPHSVASALAGSAR